MHTPKFILAGVGIAAIATTLVSFSGGNPTNKEDDDKKKKYHVIHQKDGQMQEYDTIIPMNSDYSVQDFLSDKGIEDPNPKIIEIPSIANMTMMSHDGDNAQIFMHKLSDEIVIDDENGTHENVMIIREENENGEVIMKKIVNGEEVEITDEDLKHMHHHADGEHHKIMIKDGDTDLEWIEKEGSESVELKVEVDDEGNMKVQKFVNGEEVEVSEEEMQKIENGHNNRIMIVHGDHEGDLNIEMDSIMEMIEMEVEMMDVEGMEEGQKHVIVKEFHVDGETSSDQKKEIHKEFRMKKHVEIDGEEDFTVVLVHENYDESIEESMQVRMMVQDEGNASGDREMSLNEPISVYPNPNNGTFTIAFNQKNEVKTSIRIVDAQGKVVYKEKLGEFSGAYKKELDLKKHGVGVYIVTVQQGGETSSRKVIVE